MCFRPAGANKPIKCPNCGTFNKPTNTKCQKCGFTAEQMAALEKEAKIEAHKDSSK